MHNILTTQPPNNKSIATFIFAHGAGAPMDSEFMSLISEGLALKGVTVIRFEFPYMAKRRETGIKRPPNKIAVLLETFQQVIDGVGEPPERLFIGGKSMGGRVASMLATQLSVQGVIAYGYPFHPAKKPERLRIEHLPNIRSPMLIVQGERDTLGSKQEVPGYKLDKKITINWLSDGDHSLKPRKKSGFTYEENLQEAILASMAFIKQVNDL